MSKKLVSIVITVCLCLCFFTSALGEDYSFLEGMTLEQLQALKIQVEAKINALEAANKSSDDTGIWIIKYYVDEFNLPTNEGYISNDTADIKGQFSNSAATNAKLYVRWIIDADDIAISFYEYGSSRVKNSYNKTLYYSVTMLDQKGNRISLSASIYSNGDRLYFNELDAARIKNAFRNGGQVSFYFQRNDRKSETYSFTIQDTSGFSNAWRILVGKEL